MPDRREELRPLDVDAARVVVVGTVLWALALVVVLLAGSPRDWAWICACGVGLGLLGLPVARRMQRR